MLWGSVFTAVPAGMIKESRANGTPSFISQAEGAEIDSAALTPQSAPFVVSANSDVSSGSLAQDTDVLYGEGAFKDPGQPIKTVTAAPHTARQSLAGGAIYTVAAGDTLSSISTTFGVPMNTIIEFNPSVNFSSLVPGTSVII